jgi:hypothetical protein
MRLIRIVSGCLFLLAFLSSTQALAVGLYVERLENPDAIVCPYCHKSITPGGIHENAEAVLATEFGGSLSERGIAYTPEKGQPVFLNVFVYRYQERQGGNFSVVKPASVGFHAHLFEGNVLTGLYVFDETQQPLSDNVLRIFTFFKRGGKWITAGELAREGVHKAVEDLAGRLKPEGP